MGNAEMRRGEEMREYLFVPRTVYCVTCYPCYNLIRCCYKTVNFATAASQNGVCITQRKGPK